jgi:hypothetical protein
VTVSILAIGLFVSILTNVVFGLKVIRRLRLNALAAAQRAIAPATNDLGDGIIMPMPDDERWTAVKRYKTLGDDHSIFLILGGIKIDPKLHDHGIEVAGIPDRITGDRATAYVKAVSAAYTQSKIAAAALQAVVGP